MNKEAPRFYSAFLTVLVILSVISIKMAFLYAAELLLFLVFTVPAAAAILYMERSGTRDHDN
jgi:hypothetical protein